MFVSILAKVVFWVRESPTFFSYSLWIQIWKWWVQVSNFNLSWAIWV